MREFWNERYGQEEYAYGTEPNAYFRQQISKLKLQGSILLPAEGEGRNAVYAAKRGLEVTAFDLSEEAKNKALRLASANDVNITYHTDEFNKLSLTENSFDAIGLIYAHFPANLRADYHKQFVNLLAPGGVIILEAFSKEQLKYESGGPKDPDMLFSKEEIKSEFDGLEVIDLSGYDIRLNEGPYHQGMASVVRFVGRKPMK